MTDFDYINMTQEQRTVINCTWTTWAYYMTFYNFLTVEFTDIMTRRHQTPLWVFSCVISPTSLTLQTSLMFGVCLFVLVLAGVSSDTDKAEFLLLTSNSTPKCKMNRDWKHLKNKTGDYGRLKTNKNTNKHKQKAQWHHESFLVSSALISGLLQFGLFPVCAGVKSQLVGLDEPSVNILSVLTADKSNSIITHLSVHPVLLCLLTLLRFSVSLNRPQLPHITYITHTHTLAGCIDLEVGAIKWAVMDRSGGRLGLVAGDFRSRRRERSARLIDKEGRSVSTYSSSRSHLHKQTAERQFPFFHIYSLKYSSSPWHHNLSVAITWQVDFEFKACTVFSVGWDW